MKKYIILLCLTLVGCNSSLSLSAKDIAVMEGIIAWTAAGYKNSDSKKLDKEAEIKAEEAIKALNNAKNNAKSESVYPQKYMRLLSAKKGCPPCDTQQGIINQSKKNGWIILEGSEEDNKDKKPYHGIKESVESLQDGNNPLWKKYGINSVPYWQLVVDGKVVNSQSGVMSEEQLKEFFLNGDKE